MRYAQKSDECFRRIFEDGPLGIAVVNSDYRFIEVNKTLCEMVGYTEQELLALTFFDLIHPEDADKNVQLAQQLFNGERPSYEIEKRLIKKDGQTRWINLTASLIRDEAETPPNGLVMIEDITKRKRIEIEREHLYKRVFETERLTTIGRLTSSLFHEMSNAMQAIQGALNLALEELNNPAELANYLRLSLKESEQLVRLLSRLRHSYLPQVQAVETLDLNQLLQETITLARRELKRHQVTLQTNLAPDLPFLTAVANQLYLVFLSVLLNLSDAMGVAGGGELRLKAYALSKMVRIEFSTDVSIISITGKPVDVLTEEMFASLGLSFSHHLIMAHNGTMNVSQQNGGIICSIELPCSGSDLPESG
jgi:PAS domain S-box-containing protein